VDETGHRFEFRRCSLGEDRKESLNQIDRKRERVELAPGRLNSVQRADASYTCIPVDPSKRP